MGAAKRTPTDKTPGAHQREPADSANPFSWLGDLFARRGKELIAAAVLSVGGVLTYAIWGVFDQKVKDYIVTTTVDELSSDGSRLREPVEKIFQDARRSEVGALNAGNFWLTPANRAYSLYVYFPAGYQGKLFYRLHGVTEKKYVNLVLPNGAVHALKDHEASIDLAKFVQQFEGGLELQGIEGLIERPGALKELRAITFQLAGAGVDALSADTQSPISGIEVNYVSFVSPAIHIDE